MKAIARLLIRLLAPLAVMAALAGPALANDQGFDLQIAGPTDGSIGQPVVLQVTGHNPPPGSFTYLSWLEVDLLRPQAVPACPATPAGQLAINTGGATLTLAQREEADLTGAFGTPVGFTPIVSGPLLICAYSVNEEGHAWAMASYTVTIRGDGPAKPASNRAPRVTRAGNRLVCNPGSWSALPTRFAYSWLVDGKRRKSAQSRTLAVTNGMRGHELQCSVTASNAAGSATAVSRGLVVR